MQNPYLTKIAKQASKMPDEHHSEVLKKLDQSNLGGLNKVASATDTTGYLDIGKLDKTPWPNGTPLDGSLDSALSCQGVLYDLLNC